MATSQCTAKSKRTGLRCLRPPRIGATVCHQHGGASPQVLRKAALYVVEQQAMAAVTKFGARTPVTDPLTALAEIAGEMLAVKDWIRGRVEDIDGERMRTTDDKQAEQMRAEWTAYTGMLNSCVSALAAIGKLNIDERMARITEVQAEMIIAAIKVGLAAAGVTGDAYNTGIKAAGRHLRAVK